MSFVEFMVNMILNGARSFNVFPILKIPRHIGSMTHCVFPCFVRSWKYWNLKSPFFPKPRQYCKIVFFIFSGIGSWIIASEKKKARFLAAGTASNERCEVCPLSVSPDPLHQVDKGETNGGASASEEDSTRVHLSPGPPRNTGPRLKALPYYILANFRRLVLACIADFWN